jgi:hypothetical protein
MIFGSPERFGNLVEIAQKRLKCLQSQMYRIPTTRRSSTKVRRETSSTRVAIAAAAQVAEAATTSAAISTMYDR